MTNGTAVGGQNDPIIAFQLSSVQAIEGAGYAENELGIPGDDAVDAIHIFSLTQAEYTAYVGSLIEANGSPTVTGSNFGPGNTVTAPISLHGGSHYHAPFNG